MTTALQLITTAAKNIKAIGGEEALTNTEATDALGLLNAMLDSWWLDRLAVYQVQLENFSLTSGQASRTIGALGQWVTTRPEKIESAFIRQGSVDWPLEQYTFDQYDAIAVKANQGQPQYFFYDPAYPTGTIYFYFVPSSTYTVYLRTWKRLQSFASLTEDMSLPSGYERAICWNLAVEMFPQFMDGEVPGTVLRQALLSKGAIDRFNSPTPYVGTEVGSMKPYTMNING
jgi:hypothetical protein